jgi:hypothetical protein
VPPQNGSENHCIQGSVVGDTSTPHLCAPAVLGVPGTSAQERMIQASPESSSFSEGDTHCPQIPVAHRPTATVVAGPPHRKRNRNEADSDDENPSAITGGRSVRRKLDPGNGAGAGPSAVVANSRFQPFNGVTGAGDAQYTTLNGGISSHVSSTFPVMDARPPISQPYGPNLGPDPSPLPVQVQQSSTQSSESINTVLRATNPRRGPVSGGLDIWLSGEDLATAFTLYVRFGTRVTPAVSWVFHPISRPSAQLHTRRSKMRLHYLVYFRPPVILAV